MDRSQVLIRKALIALHAVLGVSAVGAGQALARDPSGGVIGMSKDYLEGSPFPDFLIPGLFLSMVIGTANLASAAMLLKQHRLGPPIRLATGLLLVAWVAIQTGIIGYRHWSQFIWWITFPLVALLAAMLMRKGAAAGRLAR